MKTPNSAFKAIALLLFAGLLFFSCSLDGGGYGTLNISLPGSGRAAITSDFASRLSYRIECTGPGNVIEDIGPGESASVRLAAGNWNIKVGVINAADEDIAIANNTGSVTIESGKTSTLQMPITIDTSRREISGFTLIAGYQSYSRGEIDQEDSIIYVFVNDQGMGIIASIEYSMVSFEAVHSGLSITPSGPVPFSSLQSPGITVTAYNGLQKTYTVQLVDVPEGAGNYKFYSSWTSMPWGTYGLTGLPEPSGTFSTGVEYVISESYFGFSISYSMLVASVEGSIESDYDALVTHILGRGFIRDTASPGGLPRSDDFYDNSGTYEIELSMDTMGDLYLMVSYMDMPGFYGGF